MRALRISDIYVAACIGDRIFRASRRLPRSHDAELSAVSDMRYRQPRCLASSGVDESRTGNVVYVVEASAGIELTKQGASVRNIQRLHVVSAGHEHEPPR